MVYQEMIGLIICVGIIRKTRTVMECLHRFCRECIDKSMRLGFVLKLPPSTLSFYIFCFHFWLVWTGFNCSNNECPACRTHCASRRSLRDDPNFDTLIAAIYPDIDKYEEEVTCIFHHEFKKHWFIWIKN
jgi:E3 ubiquitin-protein ligase RNF1/2